MNNLTITEPKQGTVLQRSSKVKFKRIGVSGFSICVDNYDKRKPNQNYTTVSPDSSWETIYQIPHNSNNSIDIYASGFANDVFVGNQMITYNIR